MPHMVMQRTPDRGNKLVQCSSLDYRQRKSVTVTASSIWVGSGPNFFGDNSASPFPPLTVHFLSDHKIGTIWSLNLASIDFGQSKYLTNGTCKEPQSDCRSLHMCCSRMKQLHQDSHYPWLGSPLQHHQGSLDKILFGSTSVFL